MVNKNMRNYLASGCIVERFVRIQSMMIRNSLGLKLLRLPWTVDIGYN